MIVRSKMQSIELLEKGTWINATKIWHESKALLESGFNGIVAVRSFIPWGKFKPGMTVEKCVEYYSDLIRAGARQSSLFFHEWEPPESLICICHLGRTEYGYELLWSRNSNINIDTHYVHNAAAVLATKYLAGEHNWDRLQEIFNEYPESVIEFTIHNRRLGVLNWDMLVWEIRNY
ncbi:MAG: hypothetical protein WCP93_03850 [Candidatus Berkelbacteria bacterium]